MNSNNQQRGHLSVADGLIAIVTDMDEVYPELPHFALDDVAGLADFLLGRKGEL